MLVGKICLGLWDCLLAGCPRPFSPLEIYDSETHFWRETFEIAPWSFDPCSIVKVLAETFPSFTECKTLWSVASILHAGRYFFNPLAWGQIKNKSLKKDENVSKPPCLIVLEVMIFCGKALFFSKKIYLPFTLKPIRCCVCPPHTLLWCEVPLWKSGLSVSLFSLMTSVFVSIDCFLALMVSARLSVKSFSN